MIRERFPRRPLAREGSDRGGGLRVFSGELIFFRVDLRLLELKLQLVEQPIILVAFLGALFWQTVIAAGRP